MDLYITTNTQYCFNSAANLQVNIPKCVRILGVIRGVLFSEDWTIC